VPEPGVPESFKVLIKELQSLGLDIKVLSENKEEIKIGELIEDDEPAHVDVNISGMEDAPIAPAGEGDFAEFDEFDFDEDMDMDMDMGSPEDMGFSVIDGEDLDDFN